MVTIESKEIVNDYVHLVLSNGEEIDIQLDWATKFVDGTEQSLLAYEIEQAPIRAQQREDDALANAGAAQTILDSAS